MIARLATRFSLRARLVGLVLVALVPAFALAGYQAWQQRESARRDAATDATILARLLAADQERIVDGARQLLVTLARLEPVRAMDAEACSSLFADLLGRYVDYVNIGAAAPTGDIFCSAVPPPAPVNAADRAWFSGAVGGRDFAIGEYQVGRITGRRSLNFGYPALEDGEIAAVVFVALDLDAIQRRIEAVDLPGGAAITLFDRQGTVLARTPDPGAWVGRSLPEAAVFRGAHAADEATEELTGLDGVARTYAHGSAGDPPAIFVAVGLDTALVDAAATGTLLGNLFWVILVALVALAAAWYGSALISRPIRALEQATARLASGDLAARTGLPHGRDELGRLGEAFDGMASRLQEAAERDARIADRAAALADFSRNLADLGLDYGLTLQGAARRLAELIGDACTIRTVSADGRWLVLAALQHHDPERADALRRLLDATPQRTDEGVSARVAQDGEPLLMPVVDQERLAAAAKPEYRDWVREAGIASLLMVPMRAQGKVIGVLALYRDREGLPYDGDDLSFAQDLADRAALAIVNARLLEQTREELAERRRAEEALAALTHRHQSILDSAGDGIYGLDREGRTTFVNPAAASLLGWEAGELIGRSMHDVAHHTRPDGTPYPREACPIYTAFRDGEARHVSGEVFWRKDGTSFRVEYHSTPIRDDGEITGAVVTFADITDRVRAVEARIAQEAAERASEAKTQFLSRMSHELRTPLNSILGFAQLLELDDLDTGGREAVAQILRGGRHLLDLIDEVLDISRIEGGTFKLSLEPVETAAAVREAAELVAPMAVERAIAVEVRAGDGRWVLADRQRLKQGLLNLLSNAVKYNRDGGSVTVTVEPGAPGRLRVLVRDTGPGMTEAQMARLFSPFDRLGAEQTEVHGTGLGLALTKALVEAMGGTLGAESRPGEGSTFWIELATAAEPGERETAREPGPAAAGTAAGPGEGARTLLYIEDNVANVRLLERILERRPGTRLLTAGQGRLGLDLARQHRPDLILLDLHLPDLDGAEALARLRADPATREIPVVILSADATPGSAEQLLAAGASHYLTKPIDVRELLEVVDRTFGAAGGSR